MPWIGVVLRRWTDEQRVSWSYRPTPSLRCPEFCVEYEAGTTGKRRGWELPKGGATSDDTGPFATARRELWEEAAVWLGWRHGSTCMWVSHNGRQLHGLPRPWQNAWLCVDLGPDDTRDLNRPPPRWMSLEEFEASSGRTDHLELLRAVQYLPMRADCLHPVPDEVQEQERKRMWWTKDGAMPESWRASLGP